MLVGSLLTAVLAFTSSNRNHSISGALTVGNSAVLTSRFNHSVKKVYFTQKDGLVPVKIYQGPCSTIGPFSQTGHNTTHLQLPGPSRRPIDEPYMMWNSRVSYTFVVSDPNYDQDSIPCIAKVHILKDKFDYYQFIAFGRVRRPISSKCLSPAHFRLRERTGYYFVGLENFHPTNLNVTINSYKLVYNVISLSSTVFSSKYKTVQLHHTSGQDTCVLAALNESKTFISLTYFARPKLDVYKNTRITLYCISTLLSFLSCIICCCCIKRTWHLNRIWGSCFWNLAHFLVATWNSRNLLNLVY